jgi:hypothetical protein
VDSKLSRGKNSVSYRGWFEVIWAMTTTEGATKGQDFPEPMGVKISRTALFGIHQ